MDGSAPSPRLLLGNALDLSRDLESESIDCIVTSPPYFRLREYGVEGEIGWEESPEHFAEALADVFEGILPALSGHGTLFLNIGDSYAGGGRGRGGSEKQRSNSGAEIAPMPTFSGIQRKELIGIPWMVAFAMRRRGWLLRSEVIWEKPNVMPESVTDRPTRSHEHLFLFTKGTFYYWDSEEAQVPIQPSSLERYKYARRVTKSDQVRMQGDFTDAEKERGTRNIRSVWPIATEKVGYEHTATMPEKLVERCIKLGCPEGGVVLDPFCGTGTTLAVARDLGCESIGFDLDPECIKQAEHRLEAWTPRRLRRTQLELEI